MEFRVLGPLEVWADGTRVAVPSARHQCLLAAMLLSPNTVVPIARLIEALWDEEPPATARKQVQNCVSALRDRLGVSDAGLIVTDGPGYRLVVRPDQIDLLRFRDGMERARTLVSAGRTEEGVDEARRALALWRGPALDGIGTWSLSSWAAGLAEQRLGAVEQCVDWELALGRNREVVVELTDMVAAHPLREKPCAQLMIALAGGGRSSDALMVFHGLRERLHTELGVDPGVEVRAVYERVLRGEIGRSPRAGEPVSEDHDPDNDGPDEDTPLDESTPNVENGVPADGSRDSGLDDAVRMLATAVRRQWSIEAEMRSLNRPRPIQLNWSGACGSAHAGPHDAAARGGVESLVSDFRATTNRRIVVLGEPGAGKTVLAMLLTLGLLEDPRPDEPVPVLLDLVSWQPDRDHLHTWLARTLIEEYPGLTSTSAYGRDAASRLVASGRVMPVLDGLDEMPPAYHASAIDSLDRAMAGGEPFVITCRADEYERVMRDTGVIVCDAAVVAIEPVTAAAAVAYLTAREPVGSCRWQPVIERLCEDPAGPLAQALRTPLMVDLLRTAYRDPSNDPAELSDTERFPDSVAYEDHLLDAYLPAVYAPSPDPPDRSRRTARRHYDMVRARRGLQFIAGFLQRTGTQDIAWWQLEKAVPKPVLSMLLGLPPAVLFTVAGFTAAGWLVGTVYGVSFALAGLAVHWAGQRLEPRRVELTFLGTSAGFTTRAGVGAVVGTALGLGWTLPPAMVALMAVVFALGFGVHALLELPIDADRVASPARVLKGDRVAGLWTMVSFAMPVAVFYGLAFAFTKEVRFIPVLWGRFDLVIALVAGVAGAMLFRGLTPDRLATVAYGLAAAAEGGMVFPRATSLPPVLVAGVTFGLAVGLVALVSRASVVFAVTRLWLAVTGQLPLRLMAFLDDAHRRGVLRQSGAVYRFRHARLQNRLADPISRSEVRPGRR